MDIEDKISKLEEQARGRGIVGMAAKVARGSGGTEVMKIDYNGTNLAVWWHGQKVLSTHSDAILAYRPDIEDWEAEVERLYYEHIVPRQKAVAGMNALDLKARWGIEAEA